MKNKQNIGAFVISGMILLTGCSESKTVKTEDLQSSVDSEKQVSIDYLQSGKELAMSTKNSLGKNLASAISEKGADGAVEFCNIEAIPITDSMSLLLGSKIKRVTDKPRNPINQANAAEIAYMKSWDLAKENGKEHPPLITEIDGKKVGYYPIVTNAMCIQCHGKPNKDIQSATLKTINKLYPLDKAYDYKDNELRGVFVVEMNKKEKKN